MEAPAKALRRRPEKRLQRVEALRAGLAALAWPAVRAVPSSRLFGVLHRLSKVIALLLRPTGYRPAHALNPDPRDVVLRELVRACRVHSSDLPFEIEVDHEAAIRRAQAQGKGVLWCGLHHAYGGVPIRLFEMWDVPSAGLSIKGSNPAWGGCERIFKVGPGPYALIRLRRALERGCATLAILDAGGGPCDGFATAHANLIELARRVGSTIVFFRGEVDDSPPRIRLRTLLGPASTLPPERYRAVAREALERLYGHDWGVQIRWAAPRNHSIGY